MTEFVYNVDIIMNISITSRGLTRQCPESIMSCMGYIIYIIGNYYVIATYRRTSTIVHGA